MVVRATRRIITESVRPHRSLWGDAFIRLRRNRLAITGGVIILLVALTTIIYPFLSKYDFASQDLNSILEGPSKEHWLGTDELGRDVLTRLIYGARPSLAVGIFTQLIVLGIGFASLGVLAAAR